MFEALLFYTFSALAVFAGAMVITRRNAASSAIALVASFFCLASMYAMLGAHFVAVIQILVYAGAIMVLFIFVIMVLNLREDNDPGWNLSPRAVLGAGVGGLVGLTVFVGASAARSATFLPADKLDPGFGTIEQIGYTLFSGRYLLPFEVVSALLTVAVVGAVVLAKKEL